MMLNPNPRLMALIVLSLGLSSCGIYPRLLNLPYDVSGRSLNSPATETQPQSVAKYVVFVSDRNGSQDVYLYDGDKRNLINLPGLNALDEIASHPSISSDGSYIVFGGNRNGRNDIFLYDRTTNQKRNLTADLAREVRNPVISADGSAIAFEVAHNGQWDIWVYDFNGQKIENL